MLQFQNVTLHDIQYTLKISTGIRWLRGEGGGGRESDAIRNVTVTRWRARINISSSERARISCGLK